MFGVIVLRISPPLTSSTKRHDDAVQKEFRRNENTSLSSFWLMYSYFGLRMDDYHHQ